MPHAKGTTSTNAALLSINTEIPVWYRAEEPAERLKLSESETEVL